MLKKKKIFDIICISLLFLMTAFNAYILYKLGLRVYNPITIIQNMTEDAGAGALGIVALLPIIAILVIMLDIVIIFAYVFVSGGVILYAISGIFERNEPRFKSVYNTLAIIICIASLSLIPILVLSKDVVIIVYSIVFVIYDILTVIRLIISYKLYGKRKNNVIE